MTEYDSTTEDFLKIRAGVCQDFAHLMLGLLRQSQIPCRYVSGYLHVERQSQEVSQSHAWIEFWAPSHGWIPFDPTHDRAIDERYVVVGHGRHYDDVPPNKGIFRGTAREALRAEVHTQQSTSPDAAAAHERDAPDPAADVPRSAGSAARPPGPADRGRAATAATTAAVAEAPWTSDCSF